MYKLPEHFNTSDSDEFVRRLVAFYCSEEYKTMYDECIEIVKKCEEDRRARMLAVSSFIAKKAMSVGGIYALQISLNDAMNQMGRPGADVPSFLIENGYITKSLSSNLAYRPTFKAVSLFEI